jgi:hypothetical protein
VNALQQLQLAGLQYAQPSDMNAIIGADRINGLPSSGGYGAGGAFDSSSGYVDPDVYQALLTQLLGDGQLDLVRALTGNVYAQTNLLGAYQQNPGAYTPTPGNDNGTNNPNPNPSQPRPDPQGAIGGFPGYTPSNPNALLQLLQPVNRLY